MTTPTSTPTSNPESKSSLIPSDPYNLIITGVGGQGNVLASRVIGNMLSRRGLSVTIGETFGASQRGGSVMSHLRISHTPAWSPQIPKGRAHMVVALEPMETLRVLMDYGNPGIRAMVNTRPVHPVGVISGNQAYPEMADLTGWIRELTADAWFLNATDAAMTLGNPIFGNIMMVGALSAVSGLPLERSDFEAVMSDTMGPEKTQINLKAFDAGAAMTAEGGPENA